MTSKLLVIPCAGSGSRWGGYFKELLPVGENEWLLDRAIKSLPDADKTLLITNPMKVSTHNVHLFGKLFGYNIQSTFQKEGYNGLWGALQSSFDISKNYDYTYFIFPDVFYPRNFLPKEPEGHKFWVGTFFTDRSEKFGVWNGEKFVDKPKNMPYREHLAWGSWVWDKDVISLWEKEKPEDFTEALNLAIDNYGFSNFSIDYYYDMADFSDYLNFLLEWYNDIH